MLSDINVSLFGRLWSVLSTTEWLETISLIKEFFLNFRIEYKNVTAAEDGANEPGTAVLLLRTLNKFEWEEAFEFVTAVGRLTGLLECITIIITMIMTFMPIHTMRPIFMYLTWITQICLITVLMANTLFFILLSSVRRKNADGQKYHREDQQRDILQKFADSTTDVSVVFGMMCATIFQFIFAGMSDYAINHPLNKDVIPLLTKDYLITRIVFTIAGLCLGYFLYSRIDSKFRLFPEAISSWAFTFSYRNKELENLLNGTRPAYYGDIRLGHSQINDDDPILTVDDRKNNIIAIGAVGTGKTSTVFENFIKQDLRHILYWLRDFPEISKRPDYFSRDVAGKYTNGLTILETTGDLIHNAYDMAIEMGIPEQMITLFDPDDPKTHSVNITRGPAEKVTETIVDIIQSLTDGKIGNVFFQQAEKTHLKNMIYLLKMTSVIVEKRSSFGQLVDMYSDIERIVKKHIILKNYVTNLQMLKMEAMDNLNAQDPDDHEAVAKYRLSYHEIADKFEVARNVDEWLDKTIVATDDIYPEDSKHAGEVVHEDVQETFVKGLNNVLNDLAQSPTIRRVLFRDDEYSDDNFSFDDVLRNGGIVLCSTAKGSLGDKSSWILGQIYLKLLKNATFRRDPNIEPVHAFYGDEAPSWIDDSFPSFPAQSRKYNVPILIAAQSLSQFDEAFSPTWTEAMLDTMRIKMAFGDMGPNGAKTMEALFGSTMKYEESVSDSLIDIVAGQDSSRGMIQARRTEVPNIRASELASLEAFTLAIRYPKDNEVQIFDRLSVKYVSISDIANEEGNFDINEKGDKAAFEYYLENKASLNPDFDSIDLKMREETLKKIREARYEPDDEVDDSYNVDSQQDTNTMDSQTEKVVTTESAAQFDSFVGNPKGLPKDHSEANISATDDSKPEAKVIDTKFTESVKKASTELKQNPTKKPTTPQGISEKLVNIGSTATVQNGPKFEQLMTRLDAQLERVRNDSASTVSQKLDNIDNLRKRTQVSTMYDLLPKNQKELFLERFDKASDDLMNK